jgi:hypothetical protein
MFTEFERASETVVVDDEDVDYHEDQVRMIAKDSKLNDSHIIAVAIVSRCILVCTADKVAHKFIKRKELYPKNHQRPKIYACSKNTDLLIDQNIAEICKN